MSYTDLVKFTLSNPRPEGEGTCAACGRADLKAKNNLISRHGYKMVGGSRGTGYAGWQSGACAGSHTIRLEVSCEAFWWSIAGYEKGLEFAERYIAEHDLRSTEVPAWRLSSYPNTHVDSHRASHALNYLTVPEGTKGRDARNLRRNASTALTNSYRYPEALKDLGGAIVLYAHLKGE